MICGKFATTFCFVTSHILHRLDIDKSSKQKMNIIFLMNVDKYLVKLYRNHYNYT